MQRLLKWRNILLVCTQNLRSDLLSDDADLTLHDVSYNEGFQLREIHSFGVIDLRKLYGVEFAAGAAGAAAHAEELIHHGNAAGEAAHGLRLDLIRREKTRASVKTPARVSEWTV